MKTAQVDKWLNRVSQMAQIILVAITLATIYFTVIPLYQKAILEESIAKSTLELEKIKEEKDLLYLENKRYIISNYANNISFECNPLSPYFMEDPLQSSRGKNSYDYLIDIDIKSCILQSLEDNESINNLKHIDQIDIKTRSLQLAEKIEATRKKAISDVEDVDKIALFNSDDLLAPGHYSSQAINFQKRKNKELGFDMFKTEEFELSQRVERTKREISNKFHIFYLNEMQKLKME